MMSFADEAEKTRSENDGGAKAETKSEQESLQPVKAEIPTAKRKRRINLGVALMVLAGVCALTGFLIFGASSGAKERKGGHRLSQARADRQGSTTSGQGDHSEEMTAAAIEQMRSEVDPAQNNSSWTRPHTHTVGDTSQGIPDAAPPAMSSVLQLSSSSAAFNDPALFNTANRSSSLDRSSSLTGETSHHAPTINPETGERAAGARAVTFVSSRASQERSIRYVPPAPPEQTTRPRTVSPDHGRGEGSGPHKEVARQGTSTRALPPFGTMLPVRVIGSFYTSGQTSTPARLELIRTIRGEGWELERGTIMVGRVRGPVGKSRAEVSVFGFIDPQTNRLLRLEGSVLGDDGANGLTGHRRSANSLAARLGGAALRTATSAASLASGAYLWPGIMPPVPGLEGSTSSSGVFIEVASGTTGYVLVTSLPAEMRGRDADRELAPDEAETLRLMQRTDENRGGHEK